MATRRKKDDSPPRRPPATTIEGRENQLVSLAVDLAEHQLAKGTASAQVITHYLKLASTREALEQERLQKENELLAARVTQIESQRRIEELYEQALNSMRIYAGQEPLDELEYDDQSDAY